MAKSTQKGPRGGRRSLSVEQRKHFALRLYAVIRKRCGSLEAFKKRLVEKRTRVRESTVRGWLPPLERLAPDPVAGSKVFRRDWESLRTADLPGLQEVAMALDVSVDYLLGYPVPERRSDREPPGELAKVLLDHVVRDYVARTPHQRLEGIAETVGGQLRWQPLRRKPSAHTNGGQDALEIDVGNPALLRRLLLVVDNPQAFLAQVSSWVFQRAERWEEEHKEPERQEVRDEVRRLAHHVGVLSSELERSEEQVLQVLLDGALDPLEPAKQAWVRVLGRDLVAYQERTAAEKAADEQFIATQLELPSAAKEQREGAAVSLSPEGVEPVVPPLQQSPS